MTILLSKNFSLTHKLSLCVVNSFCRPVVKGNCRGNAKVIDKDNVDSTLDLLTRSTKRQKT